MFNVTFLDTASTRIRIEICYRNGKRHESFSFFPVCEEFWKIVRKIGNTRCCEEHACLTTRFNERRLFSTSSPRGLPSTDRKYQQGPWRALRMAPKSEQRGERNRQSVSKRNVPLRICAAPILRIRFCVDRGSNDRSKCIKEQGRNNFL